MEQTAGRLYRGALRRHWHVYTLGFATVFLTNATEVLTPKFVQWTIDLLIGGSSSAVPSVLQGSTTIATLHLLIVAFGINVLIAWAGRIGWRQILARRTHIAGKDLKVGLWDVLRHQPLHVFQKYSLGDLMNRATGDWNSSRFIHGFTLVLTADMVFMTILCLTSMMLIDVPLTLMCIAIFPFLPRFIVKLATREHHQHRWAQEKLSELSDLISQSLGTIRMQRATKTEALWEEKLSSYAYDYANRRFEVVKTGWKIFPIGALATLVAYIILMVFGLNRIENGSLTVGEFIALQSYVLLLQNPMFELGTAIAEWQKGFASLDRIAEIFNLKKLAEPRLNRTSAPGWQAEQPAILISDLSFRFSDDPRMILKSIDFRVNVGESAGVYGPIGSGKSTLLNIVAGLVEPEVGTTMIMKEDICDVSPEWLTQHVVMVPQRSFLFAGSIRHNLQLDEEHTDERLWNILGLVCLAEDIRNLENGLDTWIGEWGINLSGGQRQRLALARALLRPRKILLLDDCLSAVDAITEENILLGMKRELSDLTVVWVAHRRSTLRLCDRIYNLENGTMREVSRGGAGL
jgi:ATP-binding cassette subfamily B protein